MQVLSQPTFDLFEIEDFCRETLYAAIPERRKKLYDDFIRRYGYHYTETVMLQLFDDLKTLESYEDGRLLRPQQILRHSHGTPDSVVWYS